MQKNLIMQINLQRIKKSDRIMRSLTGLSIKAFEQLLKPFEQVLKKYTRQQASLVSRKRVIGGGRKHTLKTIEEKLFYILFYLKSYPTFDLVGFFYNVDRSQPCNWTYFLMTILQDTLGRELVLPKRKIKSTEEFFQLFPEIKDVFIDGTERSIQRPKKKKQQKQHYSGKKKRHMKKNILVTTATKRVLILTATKPGKHHDYALFKKSEFPEKIPKQVAVWLDLGFKGVEKDYDLSFVMPHKKSKNYPLTDEQIQDNKVISGIRVIGEHAIAGIKRLKCVTDVFRNRKVNVADTFMLLACGIWNYYLKVS